MKLSGRITSGCSFVFAAAVIAIAGVFIACCLLLFGFILLNAYKEAGPTVKAVGFVVVVMAFWIFAVPWAWGRLAKAFEEMFA